jgi:tetratricopeptide (TPR) repeat protein
MSYRLSFGSHASLIALVATGALLATKPASAQEAEHKHVLGDQLGTVEFDVACAEAVQENFNRAMALYHSFAWAHAGEAFETIARDDPTCGMAHWGRAMVMLDNPFLWPGSLNSEKLDAIAAALGDARAAGLHGQREEGYVAAVEAFVRDRDSLDHPARVTAFEKKMGELAQANPEDMEAAILHALITSANFDPTDRTYANQMRAAEILEPLFNEHPDHPGVAHYLIHTYDYPALAQQGLEAAKRYAEIAPDAAHALHMPSHTFTRVGMWEDSIASNRTSAEVDGNSTFNSHHAYDYQVYAHLQLAQDELAETLLKQAEALPPADHFAAAFAYAAMPARAALEQDDWERAKDLDLRPAAGEFPWDKYPHAGAINAFARGVGAARAGDAKAARSEHALLEGLREATGPAYWVEQVDIQAAIVAALALCAEDQAEGCLKALREAAAREDATEKHVVTPGPILPAREILADILLEQGQPKEALVEFEAVLQKEPNRYRALAGAARAARDAGEAEKARAHAEHLTAQVGAAGSERPSFALVLSIVAP